MHPHGKEANSILGCSRKREVTQQVEGGDPSSLLSTVETIFEVLCLVLGSPVQERYRFTGLSPEQGHEDD